MPTLYARLSAEDAAPDDPAFVAAIEKALG